MDRYQKIIEEIWKYEREKLKREINKKGIPNWLDEKIKKTVNRMVLDIKYIDIIKKSILTDDVLLSFLMKDPKRQNIYEKIFKNELEKEGILVEKLNSSGPNALYSWNNKISSISNDKPKELKSLDFVINYQNTLIYVVNKYTNEEGGAQDNQYKDVIVQLRHLGPNTINQVWFCLDGKYYTKEKIDSLKKINKDAIVVNLESLIKKLKNKN